MPRRSNIRPALEVLAEHLEFKPGSTPHNRLMKGAWDAEVKTSGTEREHSMNALGPRVSRLYEGNEGSVSDQHIKRIFEMLEGDAPQKANRKPWYFMHTHPSDNAAMRSPSDILASFAQEELTRRPKLADLLLMPKHELMPGTTLQLPIEGDTNPQFSAVIADDPFSIFGNAAKVESGLKQATDDLKLSRDFNDAIGPERQDDVLLGPDFREYSVHDQFAPEMFLRHLEDKFPKDLQLLSSDTLMDTDNQIDVNDLYEYLRRKDTFRARGGPV